VLCVVVVDGTVASENLMSGSIEYMEVTRDPLSGCFSKSPFDS
jgi:hypothetical protein